MCPCWFFFSRQKLPHTKIPSCHHHLAPFLSSIVINTSCLALSEDTYCHQAVNTLNEYMDKSCCSGKSVTVDPMLIFNIGTTAPRQIGDFNLAPWSVRLPRWHHQTLQCAMWLIFLPCEVSLIAQEHLGMLNIGPRGGSCFYGATARGEVSAVQSDTRFLQ